MSQDLKLFVTTEHSCGYYPDRKARNLVPGPDTRMSVSLFSALIEHGFRRSGDFVYRPHCLECRDCRPCRIKVEEFRWRRRHKRCLKRNSDLDVRVMPACFTYEYYDLYRKYQNGRHPGGGMANPLPEDFKRFLLSHLENTVFLEFRHGHKLLGVAVTDATDVGLSAMYTFFDPAESGRALGNFAILQQIRLAASRQLPFLYLGYWINNHSKMHYKAGYQPLEVLHNGQWRVFDGKSEKFC